LILIALGANLSGPHGGPSETIAAAHEALSTRNMGIMTSSRIWLTAPVPISDQPWYHNQVIQIETKLTPLALLETLQNIEKEFGRERAKRNEARVLDLDLIAYNDEILDRPELIIPHPRMHERAFIEEMILHKEVLAPRGVAMLLLPLVWLPVRRAGR